MRPEKRDIYSLLIALSLPIITSANARLVYTTRSNVYTVVYDKRAEPEPQSIYTTSAEVEGDGEGILSVACDSSNGATCYAVTKSSSTSVISRIDIGLENKDLNYGDVDATSVHIDADSRILFAVTQDGKAIRSSENPTVNWQAFGGTTLGAVFAIGSLASYNGLLYAPVASSFVAFPSKVMTFDIAQRSKDSDSFLTSTLSNPVALAIYRGQLFVLDVGLRLVISRNLFTDDETEAALPSDLPANEASTILAHDGFIFIPLSTSIVECDLSTFENGTLSCSDYLTGLDRPRGIAMPNELEMQTTTSLTTSATTSWTTSETTSRTTSPTTSATTSQTTSATTSQTTPSKFTSATSATTSETTESNANKDTEEQTNPSKEASGSMDNALIVFAIAIVSICFIGGIIAIAVVMILRQTNTSKKTNDNDKKYGNADYDAYGSPDYDQLAFDGINCVIQNRAGDGKAKQFEGFETDEKYDLPTE